MFSRFSKPLVAVLLLLALCCSLISCDDEPSKEAFQTAYEESIDDFVDSIGTYYSLLGNYDTQDMSISLEANLELSDACLGMLKNLNGTDFSWINDAKIKLSENFNGDLMSVALGLAYGGTDVVDADMIFDLANGYSYIRSAILNSTYLKQKTQEQSLAEASGMLGSVKLSEILPDKDALGSLLKKCYAKIMDGVENVSFTEKELSANGVTEKCIAYEIALSEKELLDISISVSEMLKTDSDFKKIIVDSFDAFADSGLSEEQLGLGYASGEDFYDAIMAELTEEISDMKEYTEASDKKLLTWTSYVTADFDVIGTKIDITTEDGTAVFYSANARNKNDVGKEIYLSADGEKLFEIKGDLTNDGKKLSGIYDFKLEGKSMAIIELENVDAKKLKEGHFVGSLTLSPSKKLIGILIGEGNEDLSIQGISVSTLSLKLDVKENDGKKFNTAISIMSSGSSYATINLKCEMSESKDISIPSNTTENIDSWASALDFDALINKASESGVPSEVIELFESLFGF